MKHSLPSSCYIEFRFMNFKNTVYLFFVFGIFRKLLVPHTQNVDHFAKNSNSEGLFFWRKFL